MTNEEREELSRYRLDHLQRLQLELLKIRELLSWAPSFLRERAAHLLTLSNTFPSSSVQTTSISTDLGELASKLDRL